MTPFVSLKNNLQMISLSKYEKNLILSAFQHERKILSEKEFSTEDMDEVNLIKSEIVKQQCTFSYGQLHLVLNYLDLILEKDGKEDKDVLNLQYRINGYLQTLH
ncbi:hypothetical protein ACKW6Q_14460 [Chryseobacterium kwangjuense]|uniref:Uncharacterized protein n=1 Tax=Chryseobacterium kwangjuense TaxID=267125 RepID=A0ABW9K6Z1_9FLAO